MGRRRIQIVVELLDILAVVALGAGETEETLLEDRILPVPECETEAETPEAVTETEEPVLTPPVDAAAG